MKKTVSILLVVLLIFTLFVGCNNNENQNNNNNQNNNVDNNNQNNQNNQNQNNNVDNNNQNNDVDNDDVDNNNQNKDKNDANENDEKKDNNDGNEVEEKLLTFEEAIADKDLMDSLDYIYSNKDKFDNDKGSEYLASLLNAIYSKNQEYNGVLETIPFEQPPQAPPLIGTAESFYKDVYDYEANTFYKGSVSDEIAKKISEIENDRMHMFVRAYYMGTGYYELMGFAAIVNYEASVMLDELSELFGVEIDEFELYFTSQVVLKGASEFEYDYSILNGYLQILVEDEADLELLPFQDKNTIYIPASLTNEVKPIPENDYTKGFNAFVNQDGNLVIYFYNTDEEVVAVETNNKSNPEEAIHDITNVTTIYNSEAVYFEVPSLAVGNMVFRLDMKTLEYKMVTNGSIVMVVDSGEFANAVIINRDYMTDFGRAHSMFAYDINGELIAEIGVDIYDEQDINTQIKNASLNLKDYDMEEVNGEYVEYHYCRTVVIPYYEGEYKDALEDKDIFLSYENYVGLPFSVFGKITNVQIKHTNHALNEEYTIVKVEDIENSNVVIWAQMPNDYSNVLVSYDAKDNRGNTVSYEFSIDDMRSPDSYVPICH